jgi:hypothetical protein
MPIALGTMRSRRAANTCSALVTLSAAFLRLGTADTRTGLALSAASVRTGACSFFVCERPLVADRIATGRRMQTPRWPLMSRYDNHRSSATASARASLSCSRQRASSVVASAAPRPGGARTAGERLFDNEGPPSPLLSSRSLCARRLCMCSRFSMARARVLRSVSSRVLAADGMSLRVKQKPERQRTGRGRDTTEGQQASRGEGRKNEEQTRAW